MRCGIRKPQFDNVRFLGRETLGTRSFVLLIMKMMNGMDRGVQKQASHSLAEAGGKTAVPYLAQVG